MLIRSYEEARHVFAISLSVNLLMHYRVGNNCQCGHLLCYAAWKTLQKKQFEFLHYTFVRGGAGISPSCLPFYHLLCSSSIRNQHVSVQSYSVPFKDLRLSHIRQPGCHSYRPTSKHCSLFEGLEVEGKASFASLACLAVCCHRVKSFHYEHQRYSSFGNSRSQRHGLRRLC